VVKSRDRIRRVVNVNLATDRIDDGDSIMDAQLASFGPFRLFMAERQLKKGDDVIPLGRPALDTLIALVERAGKVVTQRELISRVWSDVTVEETNLRVQIAGLRKALGDGREGARYIATVPGRGYSFVAPVTLSTRPSLRSGEEAVFERLPSLPTQLTRMIGRDDIICALSAQLMMWRFLSIVGPGGIGKTTVAISVAHALLDGFNGAVFFVDLVALTDAKLVPTTVARALGLVVQTQDPLRSLSAFIGDKKILLVLDNCEHVIDSAARVAEQVVGETPHAHVLTTSREALRVENEHVHLLYALDCPPDIPGLTAAEALAYPAVQLFMERAGAGGYAAALNDINAPIVGTICRRLDGVPLAIELAASRAGSLGIHGVGNLLDNRFGLVWHGRRTALPRHQTMSAMLDWSYNLLSEDEKAVLGRLSVFVGDFKIDAARSVAAGIEIDETGTTEAIVSLTAKSLISTTEVRGSPYYRLLETTRTFAQAKLAERGETNRIAWRHARFFSDFLQHDQLVQSRFEHDLSGYVSHIGNVRAALQWAFSHDGNVGVGVELAAWAAALFIKLSLLAECGTWCERALASLEDGTRGTKQEMILQEALALSSLYATGNSDQVRSAIERALALEDAFGDRRHHLELSFGLFRLLIRLADFRGALAVAQKSATFAEAAKDQAGQAIADFMLGMCYHYSGDQAAAQFHGERGIARAAEPGTLIPYLFGLYYPTYALIPLARTLWLRGFADQARRIAKTAIDEAASRSDSLSIGISLAYCSPIFLWSGDFQIADDYVERLIEYAGRHSLEPPRAAGLGLKGAIAIARDELETGIDLLRSALEKLTALKLHLFLTISLGALADGLRKSGQLEEALLTIDQAIGRATDFGSTFDMAELLRIKALILAAMPQYGRESAINCLTEALAVAKAQSALALELRSTIDLARLLAEGGQRRRAHHDLALVYGRFTEGLEMADLKIARQLIEDLA
jgi:predicted ATPase/DNA-binding winged helix-turn-helix (wHTH) protein